MNFGDDMPGTEALRYVQNEYRKKLSAHQQNWAFCHKGDWCKQFDKKNSSLLHYTNGKITVTILNFYKVSRKVWYDIDKHPILVTKRNMLWGVSVKKVSITSALHQELYLFKLADFTGFSYAKIESFFFLKSVSKWGKKSLEQCQNPCTPRTLSNAISKLQKFSDW